MLRIGVGHLRRWSPRCFSGDGATADDEDDFDFGQTHGSRSSQKITRSMPSNSCYLTTTAGAVGMMACGWA